MNFDFATNGVGNLCGQLQPVSFCFVRFDAEDNAKPPSRRVFYRQPTSILRARLLSKTSLALGIVFLLIVLSSRWVSNFVIEKTITTTTPAETARTKGRTELAQVSSSDFVRTFKEAQSCTMSRSKSIQKLFEL